MNLPLELAAEDHREWSEAQDAIKLLKDSCTRVIDGAIAELEVELRERLEAATGSVSGITPETDSKGGVEDNNAPTGSNR